MVRETRFVKSCMVFVFASFLVVAAPVQPLFAQQSTSSCSSLPLGIPVQNSTIEHYWNSTARSNDVGGVPKFAFNLLPSLKAGLRAAKFDSWGEAQQDLPGMWSEIDLVIYDPEHWDATPKTEQNNLVSTVKAASQLVHQHGKLFEIGPDRVFDSQFLSQLAPLVDLYILQGQTYQADPSAFQSFITANSNKAHAANPNVQIMAQVSATKGTAAVMYAAIKTVCSLSGLGIQVWSNANSLGTLKDFVNLIRP